MINISNAQHLCLLWIGIFIHTVFKLFSHQFFKDLVLSSGTAIPSPIEHSLLLPERYLFIFPLHWCTLQYLHWHGVVWFSISLCSQFVLVWVRPRNIKGSCYVWQRLSVQAWIHGNLCMLYSWNKRPPYCTVSTREPVQVQKDTSAIE